MRLRLREWRQDRGYSVRELAKRADMDATAYSRIERGLTSPTVTTLEKLAKALGIGVREFFPVGRASRRSTTKRRHG